jgi:hypothetical protein
MINIKRGRTKRCPHCGEPLPYSWQARWLAPIIVTLALIAAGVAWQLI